jgi:thimet oligopeptidase
MSAHLARNCTNVLTFATADALVAGCDAALARFGAQIDAVRLDDGNNCLTDLSNAVAEMTLASAPLCIPGLVHSDAAVREASSASKQRIKDAFGAAFSRRDLGAAAAAAASAGSDDADDAAMIKAYCAKFAAAGGLADAQTASLVASLSLRETQLCREYESTISEDTTTVAVAVEALAGVPESLVASLPRDPDANALVDMKAPTSSPVMTKAVHSETRRRVALASGTRCSDNAARLIELAAVRHDRAVALGSASHAESLISQRMAGSPEAVGKFLSDIATRFAGKAASDAAAVTAYKAAETGDAGAKLEDYDTAYYCRQLREKEYAIDEEEIKKYFSLSRVKRETMSIYGGLLGLEFRLLEAGDSGLTSWHEDVECYEATDAESGELIGHFALDLFPRLGKYAHQCICPIRMAHTDSTGAVTRPAVAMVSNMSPPSASPDGVALLRWGEVNTFFHEFGHLTHALCVKTKHSINAWSWSIMPWPGGVQHDYLEVPSMSFEQWVCDEKVIRRMAKRHPDGAPMPDEMIHSLRAARTLFNPLTWRRFIAMALFDVAIHSGPPPYALDGAEHDMRSLYKALSAKYGTAEVSMPETYGAQTWYHMVQGYDAGYYCYLWAEVLAFDVFAQFEAAPGGVFDAALGRKLRATLLEPGARQTGGQMLEAFLGRPGRPDAFMEANGVADANC